MTIGELAAKSGISVDTLRYYEKISVLPRAPRKNNGIRDYGEEFLSWLELVKMLKASGLSLDNIVKYMELARKGKSTANARRELIEGSRRALINKILALKSAAAEASYQLSCYETVLLPKTQRLMSIDYHKNQVVV